MVRKQKGINHSAIFQEIYKTKYFCQKSMPDATTSKEVQIFNHTLKHQSIICYAACLPKVN